jgi:Sulfotransferase domain
VRRKLGRGRLLRRVGARIGGQFYLDRGSDPADAIFLAGSARAGTTWISDIINHRNEYRYIFEPFHPKRLPATQHFRPRQYLRPSDRDPAFLRPMEAILSGRVRSVWTDKYNRKRLGSRRLVKEVRGNLLLGWLHANFAEVPIVLVMRHPCAVVQSQLDLPWNWHLDLADFLAQSTLMEDHLEPFRSLLSEPLSRFEQHVALWCVENYVPLRQFREGDLHLAFYEDLVTRPEAEIRRLFKYLGKPFDPSALAKLSRPSAVTRRNSAVRTGGDPVESWTGSLDPGQVRRAVQLLSEFGLDRIYGEGPMPRLDRPDEALGAVPREVADEDAR